MKLLILAIAIVVLGLASDSPVSADEYTWQTHPCASAYVTVGCMNWRLQEYDERLEALEEAIEEVADLLGSRAQVEVDLENLEAQIVRRSNALTSVQRSLGAAQNELSRVKNATSNIITAVGTFTSMRYVCCGSMEPYVDEFDLVFVRHWPDSVSVGDVVGSSEYLCSGVAHRIVSEVAGGYMISGDNREGECFVSYANVKYVWEAIAKDVFW